MVQIDSFISSVVELTKDFQPTDKREEESLHSLEELLQKYDESIYNRDLGNYHITGSAMVLSSSGILLHYHKKLNKWIQPGGHIDPGELPVETAKRETIEETGIDADFDNQLFHIDVHEANDHVHYDLRFLGHAKTTYISPPPDESQKVAWFSPSALASINEIALYGGLKKILETHFA